jgi:hypothetical protein
MRSLFLVFLFLTLSCTGVEKAVPPDQETQDTVKSVQQQKSRFDESFDPLSLDDDDWVIQKKQHSGAIRIEEVSDSLEHGNGNRKYNKEQVAFGFRVQLYSTTDYYEAMAVRDEAGTKLGDDIYVDYEQPYYKVRAGNFTDRQKAEEARGLAKSFGYADAWIIQTNVLLKEK